jgi:hypothetical protein
MTNVKALQFWFTSHLSLEDVGHRLVQRGLSAEMDYDYDDTYEWLEGHTSDSKFELNLSRQHRSGEGFEDEPIRSLFMYQEQSPTDELVLSLAQSVARELDCSVYAGFVTSTGNGQFEYLEEQRFDPNQP